MKPSKTKSEAMRHITVQKGRKKKFRIRVRNFDFSFSDLLTAKMIRDFEVRQ